jgi:phospholipase/lecithinase/hemolysin
MQPLTSLRTITLAAISMTLAAFAAPAMAQQASIDRIVAFGASLSDTGNAFIWLSKLENQACGVTPLNVPPYDTLDDFLVPDGVYAKGGHHLSNGATWLEGLARHFALGGNVRPAFRNTGTKASNYAVGGARAIADYPCRFNLPAQRQAYFADYSSTSPNALVTLEIGGNDLRDALVAAALGQNPSPIIQAALGNIAETIVALYAHGARRFLVMNVPDIGKTPAVRMIPGASGPADLLAQGFNQGLALVVQGVSALPGNDVRILDVYAKLNEVVGDPGTFGFSNTTDACVTPNQPPFHCKKPDTYVFWDGIHPTKALHDILAQQAIAVINEP